ncbi:MAG TPA: DUF6596 domain-containing protein [Streptosporangiaceae bacterium]|jgi:hypothetical protein
MAKRLVRAKNKISAAGIPYRVPPAHLLPERTGSVLAVLYLLFNEGYAATAGADLIRRNLCAEAIRLARLLVRLMPDEPVRGRGPAPVNPAGFFQWLSYGLIAAGWILATTIATGLTRAVSRQ